MPDRVTTTEFPLGAFLRRLAGNLMIVLVLVTSAIGLTQFDAAAPRLSAAREFSDPPGSGLIVDSEVIRLWVPETLVDPAGHELAAQVARTHQDLKKVLERRGQENLWYAITVRAHLADERAEESSFIRHPYRQPEYFEECMDVLTAVTGGPCRHPSADYSAAIVHIMSAGISQRDWLDYLEGPATHPAHSRSASEGIRESPAESDASVDGGSGESRVSPGALITGCLVPAAESRPTPQPGNEVAVIMSVPIIQAQRPNPLSNKRLQHGRRTFGLLARCDDYSGATP